MKARRRFFLMFWRQTLSQPTRVWRDLRRFVVVCACVFATVNVISVTFATAFDDRKSVGRVGDDEAVLGTFHLRGPDRLDSADDLVPRRQGRRRALSPVVRDDRSYSTADVLHMFADARAALEGGDRGEAQRLFEGVIAARPDSELADTARKELATLTQDYRHRTQRPSEHHRARGRPRSSKSVYGPQRPRPQSALDRRQERKQRSRRLVMLERQFIADVGDRIFFARDSARLDARARAVLVAQADWLKAHPDIVITIEGHADDGVGAESSSHNLSLARAEAVRQILTDEGIGPSRIASVGRGTMEPVAICSNANCEAQNRRVVTMISAEPIRIVGESERGLDDNAPFANPNKRRRGQTTPIRPPAP